MTMQLTTLPTLVDVALRNTVATRKVKKKFAKVVNEFATPLTCVGKISEQSAQGQPDIPIQKKKRKKNSETMEPQLPTDFHSNIQKLSMDIDNAIIAPPIMGRTRIIEARLPHFSDIQIDKIPPMKLITLKGIVLINSALGPSSPNPASLRMNGPQYMTVLIPASYWKAQTVQPTARLRG